MLKTPMVSHFPINPEIRIEKTLKEIEEKGYQTVSPLFVLFEDGLLVGSIMVEIVKPSVKDSNIKTFGQGLYRPQVSCAQGAETV